MPVPSQFDGDWRRQLNATGDFKAGFLPVDGAENYAHEGLPPAELGYERGLLRAIRDELAPYPNELPSDRFARNADPVAVGLGKLLNQEVRYGYAHKLKTGDDLVKAVESQGIEGLAFGDLKVHVSNGSGESRLLALHFPVFYDYDPKTRTLAYQEWTHGERRVPVDAIENIEEASLYYRPSAGLAPFLTPQEQPNFTRPRRDDDRGPLVWDRSRGFDPDGR
jgi:hypothetical protein